MALHRIAEETSNILFAGIAAWGAAVAVAALENVFNKFDAMSVACFAVGIALYALAAYRIDRGTHDFIQRLPRGVVIAAACLSVATLAGASFRHVPALAVFVAPLAAVACAAAAEKLSSRPTKGRAKSPAGSRAAT